MKHSNWTKDMNKLDNLQKNNYIWLMNTFFKTLGVAG